MPRWVSCAECASRYDAEATPFCPRCGSTVHGKAAPGQVPVIPNDPRRRRVQMGGAIFLFIGLTVMALTGYIAFVAHSDLQSGIDQYVQDQGDAEISGGILHLQVLRDGAPVPGAMVNLTLPSGRAFQVGATDGHGWYNTTLTHQAAVHLNITAGNVTLHRQAFILKGLEAESRLDLARDAPEASGYIGLEGLESLIPVFLGVTAGTAALAALAGACALGLRAPNFAVAGPIPLMLLCLILLVASLQVGAILLVGLEGVALWMVATGRAAFRKRRQG